MKVNLINLTPHKVVFLHSPYKKEDVYLIIEPSGTVCRALTKTTIKYHIRTQWSSEGIPITDLECEKVVNLPDPQPDTLYIVSDVIARLMKGARTDLVVVGGVVRAPSGKVIGCKSISFLN